MIKFQCSNCDDVIKDKSFLFCDSCQQVNTCIEMDFGDSSSSSSKDKRFGYSGSDNEKSEKLNDVKEKNYDRIKTGFTELDLVMGGDGVVSDSINLIGGDPGIGKSTLLLQVAINVSKSGLKVLYITGEESKHQVKSRANRISNDIENIYICSSSDIEYNLKQLDEIKPNLLIVDSIQTMFVPTSTSAMGSVTQVKESAQAISRYCKRNNIATFIVGHITKDGGIAGPKVLEHIVDGVFYFEGDENGDYRILRSNKNRFGRVNEMAVFAMKSVGLEQIKDPSSIFVNDDIEDTTGSVIYLGKDGSRPIMMEVQSLVSETQSDNARRLSVGLDRDRLNLMIAIIQKQTQFRLYKYDIYATVVGGLKINETAYDVALIIAILSSLTDRKVEKNIGFFGEVGLSGEIKNVQSADLRVADAKKRGLSKVVMPFPSFDKLDRELKKGIEIIPIKNVRELVTFFHNNSRLITFENK